MSKVAPIVFFRVPQGQYRRKTKKKKQTVNPPAGIVNDVAWTRTSELFSLPASQPLPVPSGHLSLTHTPHWSSLSPPAACRMEADSALCTISGS